MNSLIAAEQTQFQKGAWWILTAVAAAFEGAWVLTGATPPWYATAIAIAVAVSGVVLGKPWAPPKGPD